jgi:hypothetical protein
MKNLERYRSDLSKLLALGERMESDLMLRHDRRTGSLPQAKEQAANELSGTFEREYQEWYSEAQIVIRQLLPARAPEFELLYYGDPKRKAIEQATYTIRDWLLGVRAALNRQTGKAQFEDLGAMAMRFVQQRQILHSVQKRFDSTLFDIARLAQADLFDSEIDAARELLKHRFSRAAGIVAGVVLEKHLQEVALAHGLTPRRQRPTISDFNDALKEGGTIDVPTWRQIQHLGDVRNLCGHSKEREPTDDEVRELIDGTAKITKTVA